MSWAFAFRLIAANLVAELGEVLVESTTDTLTDVAIDKVQAELNKRFPDLSNPQSLSSKFFQTMKMQVTARSQARIMSMAMNGQNKITARIDAYKNKVRQENLDRKQGFNNRVKNVVTGGMYSEKIDKMESDIYTYADKKVYQNFDALNAGSNHAGAFSQGLGSTKNAYDNANNLGSTEMNKNLLKLINTMGYFNDKG